MNRACNYYIYRFVTGRTSFSIQKRDRGATGDGRDRRVSQGGKRVRGAILAVAISLIPLITVIEVSSGMIRGITERYLAVGTFHMQVRFFGELSLEQIVALKSALNERDDIKRAFLVYEGVGLLSSESGRLGVTIRSYTEDLTQNDSSFAAYITLDGDYPDHGSIAVSEGVAEELEISTGSHISLVVARTLSNGRMIPKQHTGPVAGTFSTGYADLDGQSVLVGENVAHSLFPGSESVFIGMKLENPFDDTMALEESLTSIMPSGAYIYTWRELERGMYGTFETTQLLLIIVMAVIVAVATITISSSLFILVAERESEIALLRSTGANARDIQRSFVLLGLLIGVIGATIGTGLGLLVSLRINEIFHVIERLSGLFRSISSYILGNEGRIDEGLRILDPSFYLIRIPVTPHLVELAVVTAASIAISTVSAWIPARRAARIVPVESLSRH